MEPGLFTYRYSHADWMLMALKFLETALTQLSDDILRSSVYHVLHWSLEVQMQASEMLH
jgi:hypothetical protein